jgi:hypothetical protein
MIEVTIRLSTHDEYRATQLDAVGFHPEEAYDNKEALGRILVSNHTWKMVLREVMTYLTLHYEPDTDWRIRILRGRIEVRRVESFVNPAPIPVTPEVPRVSRYARLPVI